MTTKSNSSEEVENTCAICLGSMKSGQGQAIFTAECSHSFHFTCISKSVKHGNRECPICRCNWKDIPFQFQDTVVDPLPLFSIQPPANRSNPRHDHTHRIPETEVFSDDEPLPTISALDHSSPGATRPELVTLKAIPELPAIAAAESVSSFAVLIGVQAPTILENARNLDRAPIDLVTVLDVSSSMTGSKISLLKRAVIFVIQNLGPFDRLSIVTFSSTARRIFPLRRMTEAGRVDAAVAINSVRASGSTNIVDGLKKGVKVLEERREKNPVASIILLSDGQDTENSRRGSSNSSNQRQVVEYLNLLPPSICPSNYDGGNEAQLQTIPVHTFGFGSDHDSSAMHAISDASGGTFSFIESDAMVQDSFARCIGGLLSVTSQELQITMWSVLDGVKILSIPSGQSRSEISDEGKRGLIDVGDLYADEEKQFLVHLSVPSVSATVERTRLLEITCSYKDVVSKDMVQVSARVDIGRPEGVSATDLILNVDVDRQRNRLLAAEGIAMAKEMAEAGDLAGAQTLLENRRVALTSSVSAQAGDDLCTWLEVELREIRDRMTSRQTYAQSGRAMLFSGMSSHSAQRATSRGNSSYQACFGGYSTPAMKKMVKKSQTLDAAAFQQVVPLHSSPMALGRDTGNIFQAAAFGSNIPALKSPNPFDVAKLFPQDSATLTAVSGDNGNTFEAAAFGSHIPTTMGSLVTESLTQGHSCDLAKQVLEPNK